jgi:hypothetical protein
MGLFMSKELTADELEFKAAIQHRAIEKGIQSNDVSAFFYPIHQGADPNRRNADRVTLLELAIELQRVEMVGFLCTIPEVDLTLTTSKGLTALELAQQKHAALDASDPLDAEPLLNADAIVDMVENPSRALLFRRGYDKHIDKMLAAEAMRKQRNFGLYYIAFVLLVHSAAFIFPDSDSADLLKQSPIFRMLDAIKGLARTSLIALGVSGGARSDGKDEI